MSSLRPTQGLYEEIWPLQIVFQGARPQWRDSRCEESELVMKVNYPVGDFLIQIKNANLVGKREVSVGKTKLIKDLAKAMKRENFLEEVKEKDGEIRVRIAYRKKRPLLLGIKLVSKPGLRIYMGVDEIADFKGPSVFFVSTSKGVLSSKEAIKKRVGGEVIAEVL